jgi:hypothetical protein
LDDAILSRVEEEKEDDASNLANSQKESSIFVTSSSFNITMGKWEKLKPTGKGPCPRRHHSMTCLPSTSCKWSLIEQHSNSDASFDLEIPVRRLLFFGGQSEGIPFDAFNDLYLLLIEQPIKRVHGSNVKSRWIKPAVDGIAPLSRSGHVTTLLSPTEVLISGGSNGTNPIQNLDVIILHIEENHSESMDILQSKYISQLLSQAMVTFAGHILLWGMFPLEELCTACTGMFDILSATFFQQLRSSMCGIPS